MLKFFILYKKVNLIKAKKNNLYIFEDNLRIQIKSSNIKKEYIIFIYPWKNVVFN